MCGIVDNIGCWETEPMQLKGPQIGVASTKAFSSQVAVLTMLALYLGRMRHLSSLQGGRMLEEIKGCGGPVIAVACGGGEEVAARTDEVIYVPDVLDYLQPLVAVVPLQLLAYHIALLHSCDVDQPCNLAKSVTVE